MHDVIAWLTGLPPLALYLSLALVAALENVFPPIPADTVVALGAFLAAQGQANPVATFGATWLGNMSGVALTYWLGRRYGSEWIARRFLKGGRKDEAEARLRSLYGRYGVFALAFSRFLPGFRAVVPPLAGALELPAVTSLLAMAAASAVWYGGITWLGFRIGSDFDVLLAKLGAVNRVLGIAAAVLAVLLVGGWLLWRRRRRA